MMNSKTWITASLCLGISALIVMPSSLAHNMAEHEGHHQDAAAAANMDKVSVKLSNLPLIDADGHSLRLKNDIIGDRVVVVSLVYTNCTTVCPVISSILSDLQNKLGDRFDKEVRMVTLTVDPARDTPSRLKSYAEMFNAKPGWFWLTGKSANVTAALKGFGAYTANFENHPVIVLIGDTKTGKWSRHYALSSSDQLLSQVEKHLNARNKGI